MNFCNSYYLNNDLFDNDEVSKEITLWSKCQGPLYDLNIENDNIYLALENDLNSIKSKINTTKDNNNLLNLYKQGLLLSEKICDYCINKGYDTSTYIKFKTKNNYIFFKENIEFCNINIKYNQAKGFESNGQIEDAIQTYINILDNHLILGSAYYSEPFYLCIQVLEYETAIKIFNYLKLNISKYETMNIHFDYNALLEDFNKIIANIDNYENMYFKIKNEIIYKIKNTPGIIQSDLYKNYNFKFKDNIRLIIYYLNKANAIKREKSGRSYKLYLLE